MFNGGGDFVGVRVNGGGRDGASKDLGVGGIKFGVGGGEAL